MSVPILRAFSLLVGLALGLLLLPGDTVDAQNTTTGGFQYVIKFFCGEADPYDAVGGDIPPKNSPQSGQKVAEFGQFIAPGEYHTVINIHNPNERFINMFKKIALDGWQTPKSFFAANGDGEGNTPGGNDDFEDQVANVRPRFIYQQPGPIVFVNIFQGDTPPLSPDFPDEERYFSFTPKEIRLSPDEAFQVNCSEIRAIVNDYTNRGERDRANANGENDDEVADGDTDTDELDEVNNQGEFGEAFLIKGYFVVFSELRLDITGIYSACQDDDFVEENITGTNAIDFDPEDPDVIDEARAYELSCDLFSSLDVVLIKENIVPPPSSLVPPPAVTGVSLLRGGQELQVSVKAERLSALSETRLTVYDTSGRMLHDSGFVAGTQLSWRPMSSGRPLANGVYAYVLAVKDVFGRTGYRAGKFAILR